MKKVRMLLRVSSNQQLEADGDLSVQRCLVLDYIQSHDEWELDDKEYFEGSMSGYKTAVADRDVLQEALRDAQNSEYDILVAYKDDRIGRRMWEIGAYIMTLKNEGVDIYTVKDGCISPESTDIMGQMMLALRYGNAQKSSSDTGMRVKDTAQKLVQKGKFVGGKAPYGYELVESGEISKHGRVLHTLSIIPEQAEVVKYIYNLSLNKEYGSSKIARILNEDERFKKLAPNAAWKGGTITSILTNPVYAGHVAYKRREHINGKYHRLDSKDWIKAVNPDENIQIIDGDIWDRTQDKRKLRSDKYIKTLEHKNISVIRRNDGMLALIDVIHCGYCGCKLTNGTKYSYWTIKGTGEKKASITPVYRCQSAREGVPHNKVNQFRADGIEKIVFECLGEYINRLQENDDIMTEIEANETKERKKIEAEVKKLKKELDEIIQEIETMQSNIPKAMTGKYDLSLKELADVIHKHQEKEKLQIQLIMEKEEVLKQISVGRSDWKELKAKFPTWKQVFKDADKHTQRVLVNRLVERIDVTEEQIVIRFRINLNDFLPQPRMSGGSGTIPYIPCSA